MFSFLLGAGAAFVLAIYKPQWFSAIKEQVVGLFTKAGVETPESKKDE